MTMNITKIKLNTKIITLALATLLIYSCGDSKQETTTEELPDTDTVKAVALNVGGELFSIPSPINTLMKLSSILVEFLSTFSNCGNLSSSITTFRNRQSYSFVLENTVK